MVSLPRDYFNWVKQTQREINEAIEGWGVRRPTKQEVEDIEAFQSAVDTIRSHAARVRDDGFEFAKLLMRDRRVTQLSHHVILEAVQGCPYQGEAGKVWVRGFCQGASVKEVVDPKPYMDMVNADI